jgi:hypothetical protein
VAERVAARQASLPEDAAGPVAVACAYLELSTPSLLDAVQVLVECSLFA